MKRKLQYALLSILIALSTATLAQEGIIKGKVLTSEGKPAQNISVQLLGKKQGASTDNKGAYQVDKVKPGDYIIKVSAVGLNPLQKNVSISADEVVELNFSLTESYAQLQEVIIGGGRTNKFSRSASVTVAKIPLKDLENPQVYTSVSKELILDQMIVTYSDALKNVPGVILQLQNNGNGPGGTVAMRGFTGASYLRNGVPGMTVGYIDPVNLESLEAIKGPSGTLFGSSLTSFGGLFNRVTKKPHDVFEGTAAYSVGSYGLNRVTADVNVPLNADKTLLFRVSGAKHYEGSFQDAGFMGYTFVAPSLTYKLSDRLTIFLDGEYMKGKNNGFYRLFADASNATGVHTPAELNFDFKRRFVGDDMETFVTTGNFYAQADYEMGKGWKSQTNFSYSGTDANGASAYLSMAPGNLLLTRNATLSLYSKNAMIDLQQNFTSEFKIAELRNRLLVGLDFMRTETRASSSFVAFDQIDAINPTAAAYAQLTKIALTDRVKGTTPNRTRSSQGTYSAYVQDVLDITSGLIALLSLRIDRFENRGTFNLNSRLTTGKYDQTAFAPKFGLVYQPIKDKLSVFANYMNGFQNVAPVTQPDQSISTFKPRQANQTEGGVKLNLLDGKLTSTMSYYYIKVNNTVRIDPDRPGFSIQNGNQLSKGFEAEAVFNPIPGFNLVAGYAYNDSKYLKASASVDGLRPESAGPKTMVNGWVSYRVGEGVLRGFGLGLGGNYASSNITAISTTSLFTLPAYTVINASLSYDQQKYRVGLKANNLNNENYFIGWGTTIPQMPRNFIAEFALKFGGVK
ncbi:iron complex outermembrane receptor protein [Pedobacter sp. AK017]|uniref:TonB-dependent receptor n=1 Tax=Pedobacter sp. AK017 TaxID=2723073 RepID=UPI001618543E|nr:TonB-dependent receptor [Pedobacter sp. AK017]MBB5441313.1 iron complex outermembrane receptor protein [Pedobacter sp. AK017]